MEAPETELVNLAINGPLNWPTTYILPQKFLKALVLTQMSYFTALITTRKFRIFKRQIRQTASMVIQIHNRQSFELPLDHSFIAFKLARPPLLIKFQIIDNMAYFVEVKYSIFLDNLELH